MVHLSPKTQSISASPPWKNILGPPLLLAAGSFLVAPALDTAKCRSPIPALQEQPAQVPDLLPCPKHTQSQEPPHASVSPLQKGTKYLLR